LFFDLYVYALTLIAVIAMDDGIIDSFGEADQDIGIFVLGDMVFRCQMIYQLLQLGDASGGGRKSPVVSH